MSIHQTILYIECCEIELLSTMDDRCGIDFCDTSGDAVRRFPAAPQLMVDTA
jgi:hypothetical protein